MYVEFAARLEQAMAAKSIKLSPTVLGNLFNSAFDGRAVTPHTARNWMLGKSMPTQEKLVVLAELLDTSAEQLRYGTGGPPTVDLLPTLAELQRDLAALELLVAGAPEREVREGKGHDGLSAVVQVLGRKAVG